MHCCSHFYEYALKPYGIVSSKSYNPPAHSSTRKSDETSSRRSARLSASLAPDPISARRSSNSVVKRESKDASSMKRKRTLRSSNITSVLSVDDDDDGPISPRKRRKAVDEGRMWREPRRSIECRGACIEEGK